MRTFAPRELRPEFGPASFVTTPRARFSFRFDRGVVNRPTERSTVVNCDPLAGKARFCSINRPLAGRTLSRNDRAIIPFALNGTSIPIANCRSIESFDALPSFGGGTLFSVLLRGVQSLEKLENADSVYFG